MGYTNWAVAVTRDYSTELGQWKRQPRSGPYIRGFGSFLAVRVIEMDRHQEFQDVGAHFNTGPVGPSLLPSVLRVIL